jgi:hypothetical protein
VPGSRAGLARAGSRAQMALPWRRPAQLALALLALLACSQVWLLNRSALRESEVVVHSAPDEGAGVAAASGAAAASDAAGSAEEAQADATHYDAVVEAQHGVLARDGFDLRGLPLEQDELFEPGSLIMPRNESLFMCQPDFVPAPLTYGLKAPWRVATYSKQYNILLYMIEKSGSSTGRHVMKHFFNGTEVFELPMLEMMFNAAKTGVYRLVAVREPLHRFFSQYDEVFVRHLGRPRSVPRAYRAFAQPYEGWPYKQYDAFFRTEEGRENLTRSFKQFLRDYDGRQEFDEHIRMQVHHMWDSSAKEAFHFDRVVDLKRLEQAFVDLAEAVGVAGERPKLIWGRKYPRRFDVTQVTDDEIRKICTLAKVDYCCLNYELPPQCKEASGGQRVRCKYSTRRGRPAIVPVLT